jgi:hypothetical protein
MQATGSGREAEMLIDIDCFDDADAKRTTFSAVSSQGEAFLGGLTLVVPTEEAQAIIERAEAAGLTVEPYL